MNHIEYFILDFLALKCTLELRKDRHIGEI